MYGTKEKRLVWLDTLPSDVCERIAAHVSAGLQTVDALCLAEVSPRQRIAVLHALTHKFEQSNEPGARDYNDRWARIFAAETHELRFFPDVRRLQYQDCAESLRLFQAPVLRKASVWDDPLVLLAAAKSKSLRQLQLFLTHQSPPELICNTLSSLNLERLSIHCWCSFAEERCPLSCFHVDKAHANYLPSLCPRLVSLEVDCDCLGDDDPFQTMLPAMPLLRDVKLRVIQKSTVPFLRRLDSVQVYDVCHQHYALENALVVGNSVTEISSWACFDGDAIFSLACFPRLTVLRCSVSEEAAYVFAGVADTLTALQVLDLRWHTVTEIKRHDNAIPLADAESGVLLNVVQTLPNLIELHLTCVRISLSELCGVLQRIGPRLEKFGTDISGQEERPMDRLERLLHCASQNNRSLRRLHIAPNGLQCIRDGLSGNQVYSRAVCTLAAVHRLQQNAPFFHPSPIDIILWHVMHSHLLKLICKGIPTGTLR